MLFALAIPVSAASSQIGRNISTTACKGNLSDYSLPASVSTASAGQKLYINVAATSDIKLKSIEAYVSVNGGSYTLIGKETANNYMRWAYFSYTPNSTGSFTFLVRITHTNGTVQQGTSSLTVTKGSNSSSVSDKIEAFLNDSRFKSGTSWGYYQKPKVSSYSGIGCCAYTADYVKVVFGKNSPRSGSQYSKASDIRMGDVVVMKNTQHWFVVISRSGNSIKVAEGNYNSRVAINTYTISGNYILRANGSVYKTFDTGYHYC